MTNCAHIIESTKQYNVCGLGFYNGKPSHGTCSLCIANGQNNENSKIQGLGDIVHKVARPIAKAIDRTLGTDIENCGGCKERRKKLNAIFPINSTPN